MTFLMHTKAPPLAKTDGDAVVMIDSFRKPVNDRLFASLEGVPGNIRDAGGNADIQKIFAVRKGTAADRCTAIGNDDSLTGKH